MADKLDRVAAGSVDFARQAVVAAAGDGGVGDHLEAIAEGDRVVTHTFECLHPGYKGWHWAVTVVRASRARSVTINEVVLLPGPDALLAPSWIPWSERIGPGDVAPGMLLATPDDDPRLQPGYTAGSDPKTPEEAVEIRAVVRELGLGRQRVLTQEGRDLAAERWSRAFGSDTPEARQAPAPCSTCGYFIRLRGELGAGFGACANSYSPSDGHIVTIDHGCGAHSDVVEEHRGVELPPILWDDSIDTSWSIFD